MSKLCRNRERTQQVSESKSLVQEMKQNIILSSDSNKLELDQDIRVNLLTYWKTFEILCNSIGNIGDFATFVDISKQCRIHHTEGDILLYWLKGKSDTYIPLSCWPSSEKCPCWVLMLGGLCLSLHLLYLWSDYSLQQHFHHSCLGLLLHVFSPASPGKVFLIQSNTHLWILQPFTDNLSYDILGFA